MPSLARERRLHKQVAAVPELWFSRSPEFCRKWKKAIANGLVDNITNILVSCCDGYIDDLLTEADYRRRVGTDQLWDLFVVNVITLMMRKGAWPDDGSEIHMFLDTANGCDEIIDQAGATAILLPLPTV